MRWYQRFFRRELTEKRLDDELRFHLEKQIEQNIAHGMNPEDARRRARLEFGGLDQVKEECRDVGAARFVETLIQDLRYGLRQLRRNPGFTAVVIIILALGIGADTAIFSLENALLFRKLPVSNPEQLVILTWAARKEPENLYYTGNSNPRDPRTGRELMNVFTYSTFKAIQRRAHSLTDVFAFAPLQKVNIVYHGSGQSGIAQTVSGNYFSALGIRAAAGRLLQEGDDRPNAPCTAVISYRFWQTVFGGNTSLPGQTVAMDGRPCTVVGITPKDFQGLQYFGFNSNPDVTVPIAQGVEIGRSGFGSELPLLTADNRWGLQIIARLKPGTSERQAEVETNGIFEQRLGSEWTSIAKSGDLPQIVLLPGGKGTNYGTQTIVRPVTILMVVVALLLLIACANIAGLFIARGAVRSKEFTVRLALGASRGRLVRQLLTESLLLVSAGGIVGFLLAWSASRLLVAFLPTSPFMNAGLNVSPDLRVFAFAAGLTLFTGIVFGFAPAVQATRMQLTENLKDGVHSTSRTSGGKWLWSRKALVASQLALSLLLVVAAGLLVQTFQNLKSANLGFNPRNILLFSLNPTANGYSGGKLDLLYNRLLDSLDAIPGVASATASSDVLISDVAMSGSNAIEIEGAPPSGKRMSTTTNYIAPHFFKTMGIPLLAGRGPQPGDTAGSLKVAIINEAFARRYFPKAWPLGRRFRWRGSKDWIRVVGLIGNTKFRSVRAEPPPIAYLPFLQSPWPFDMSFEVRAAGNSAAVTREIYSAVHDLDPDLPVVDMRTEEDQINGSLSQEGLSAELAGFFGALGLILACVGLYGIIAYSVTRRTHEIGIRMALGAEKGDVLRMVVGQGLKLALIGVAIGVAGALVLTRFLTSLLYGVKATDPLTFIAVSLILIAVALLACYIPARRAAKVDPMVALRHE